MSGEAVDLPTSPTSPTGMITSPSSELSRRGWGRIERDMIPKKIVPSTDRAVAFTRDDVRVGIAYAAPRRARGKALVFIGEGAVSQSA